MRTCPEYTRGSVEQVHPHFGGKDHQDHQEHNLALQFAGVQPF